MFNFEVDADGALDMFVECIVGEADEHGRFTDCGISYH